ncbi:MAG: response regulator [Ferruginibacter sp.]
MEPNKKTILYVDDDADDRELLGDIMQKTSPECKIMYAENGLQAIEILTVAKDKKLLPCLIILDLNMPYLDGRQTFERIKADIILNSVPVVILSSGKNPADKSYFGNAGIPYFTKPIDIVDMESLANNLSTLCE